MSRDNEKKLERIRVENQIEDGTTDLLWRTRFDFNRDLVTHKSVNSCAGCIVAESNRE